MSYVIIPITISSQHDQISCPILVDTGSTVTLLREKIQRQLTFLLPHSSHVIITLGSLVALTTLGTVQVDIRSDQQVWLTPVIVVSSLAHPHILGRNVLKLAKSKIEFETNTIETG